jgi:hypothetical protein
MSLEASTSTGAPEEVNTAVARPAKHITVALIPTAETGLRLLQERTNLSKTDIANRAITSYEFLDAQLFAGRDLIVRDPKTGESQLVRFL